MVLKHALMFLLFSSAASATDVQPVQRFGKLVVRIPQEFKTSKTSVPKMTFRMNTSASVVKADVEAKIAAGMGCLTISNEPLLNIEVTQCGIEIKSEQLTEVQLSGYALTFDRQTVDIGPRPLLQFKTTDKDRTLKHEPTPLPAINENTLLLMPAMSFEVSFFHPDLEYTYAQTLSISAGQVSHEKLNNPEGRGELKIVLVDGVSKFTQTVFNTIVAVYGKPQPNSGYSRAPSRSIQNGDPGPGGNAYGENYFRFKADAVEQSIKAFPLKKGHTGTYYRLVVNEHEVQLSFPVGQVVRLPLATMNVFSFNTKRAGRYLVYSNRDDRSKMAEVLFIYSTTADNLVRRFFNNESSMFMPFGFKYRFDFYATDDLGRDSLQDQVEVDLTTAP